MSNPISVKGAPAATGLPLEPIAVPEHVELQRLQGVAQLAGEVAHDLNNLLAVMLTYAQLTERSLGEGHPAGADLREIRIAAERAAALTRRLLVAGRAAPPPAPRG
jgi:signal transduction histidine kinase